MELGIVGPDRVTEMVIGAIAASASQAPRCEKRDLRVRTNPISSSPAYQIADRIVDERLIAERRTMAD